MSREADAILRFWFEELGPEEWFLTSDEIDARIRADFLDTYEAAAAPGTDAAPWLATPAGSLALIILLDQFPRNMFRGSPRAFASDGAARQAAEAAIARGHDLETPVKHRVFFYMPFEHSERLEDQERAVRLVRERADLLDYLRYAEIHRDIIRRFGRFPHRNAILGRPSTAEERDYLGKGAPTFGTAAKKEN